MMENSGSLSKNLDKKKPDANPNWPDYKGKGQVGGVKYWFAAWVKKGKDGSQFLSLSFTEMKDQTDRQTTPKDDDNTLPF